MPRAAGIHAPQVRPVEDLLADAGLSGKVGFVVADARTGKVLERKSPLLALPPASVTKSITALYALDRLGPAYRFQTRLIAKGPVATAG